jgi:hypothetical protein
MAAAVLDQLPAAIEAELSRIASIAWLLGMAHAERIRRQRAERRRRPTRLDWLTARLGDPELRARALGAPRFDDAALARVLEGRAQLSPRRWRKLRRELGETQ